MNDISAFWGLFRKRREEVIDCASLMLSVSFLHLTLATNFRCDNQMRILELFKLCDTRIVTDEVGVSSSVTDVSQQFKLSAINDSRKFTLTLLPYLPTALPLYKSHKRR